MKHNPQNQKSRFPQIDPLVIKDMKRYVDYLELEVKLNYFTQELNKLDQQRGITARKERIELLQEFEYFIREQDIELANSFHRFRNTMMESLSISQEEYDKLYAAYEVSRVQKKIFREDVTGEQSLKVIHNSIQEQEQSQVNQPTENQEHVGNNTEELTGEDSQS